MHAGAKCRTGIDMKHHLVSIFRFDIFPGRDHQDIIDIELVEILFPVVDPVNVLRLIYHNRSLADIHKLA